MKKGWLLAGLALYIVFLMATAPANTLLPLAQLDKQGVYFSGVQGSVWNGQAAQLHVSPVQLMDVRWRIRPLALILGRLEFSLTGQLQGQAVQGRVGSSLLGRRYLSNVEGRIAASDLVNWRRLKQVSLDGYLDFSLDEIQLPETGVPAVAGLVNWTPARIAAPIQLELGKAQLEIRIEDGATRGKLQVTGGALLLQGDVELNPTGAYRLNANLQQKGQVPQEVSNFLSSFAEYRNGNYQLEWSDSL